MKIVLGTLKDQGEELKAFLEPRVGAPPTLAGGSIELEDDAIRKGVKARDVKTYIKRYLFMHDLRKSYRVFVEGNQLTLQELELSEEEEKKEAKPEEPKEKEAETEREDKEAPEKEPKKSPKTKESGEPKKKPARKKKADAKD